MMNEIWKDINGYEELYQVSNFGNVKSLNYRNTDEEKILKNRKDKGGYLRVFLCKNKKRKYYLIHRLVALAFIPNPDNKPCIDHINTDRTDNRVCNLQWCSHKENSNNPNTKNKVMSYSNYKSKPIIQFSKDGELIRKWDCIRDVQREMGINNASISECCNGKRKTAGGYIWRYHYKSLWLKNHIPLKDKMVS